MAVNEKKSNPCCKEITYIFAIRLQKQASHVPILADENRMCMNVFYSRFTAMLYAKILSTVSEEYMVSIPFPSLEVIFPRLSKTQILILSLVDFSRPIFLLVSFFLKNFFFVAFVV